MSVEPTGNLFDVDIEPRGRQASKYLFLPRPARNPDFVRYSAPGAGDVVYIHRSAVDQALRVALDAAPNETIGMLLGRPCTDEMGGYTLVMAVEQAQPEEYVGTPGSVRISAQGRAAMVARAAQRNPGLENVGWYHTHPHGAARFSSTDFEEQRTLLDHQVGIVAAVNGAAGGADPLGVYLGPSGHRLTSTGALRTLPPPRAADPPARNGAGPKLVTAEMLKRLQLGAIVIVGLLVASQGLTALWVHGAIKGDNALATTSVVPSLGTAPTPRVVTRTRRVVIPALVATRACRVGDRLAFVVRVPPAFRDRLAVEALDPGLVAVGYDPGSQRVSVDCLAAGNTVIAMRHGLSGSMASVAVSVNYPNVGG